MPKIIFINVTAAHDGGGTLTIINQFLQAFSVQSAEDMQLIVFCSVSLSNFGDNRIVFVPCPRQNFFRRLYWDYRGMKKWASFNNIKPDVIFSFQNTGVFFKKVPQIIYLHQSIPFSDIRWNPLKKEERTLWFYKKIYPLLIKITLFPQTRIIVQTRWMRDAVSKYFNFPEGKILIAKPECEIPDDIKTDCHLEKGFIHFFYPSRTAVYKNHLQIIKIAHSLSVDGNKDFKFHFTCTINELPKDCQKMIDGYNLKSYFVFHNKLNYTQVLQMYQMADCLIFPSKIETIGLPLLEAAAIGMPIICADMAYTRETLEGYDNVTYVPVGDTEPWTTAIRKNEMQRKYEIRLQDKTSSSDWGNVIHLLASL